MFYKFKTIISIILLFIITNVFNFYCYPSQVLPKPIVVNHPLMEMPTDFRLFTIQILLTTNGGPAT